MSSASRIQITILSHNRPDCLPRLFTELLLPASEIGVQVTVVDNASEPDVQQYLSQFVDRPNVQIVLNSENLGVGRGRNAGFRLSDREFVVYLDDDSLMGLDEVLRVPDIFDEALDVGILAFRVVHGETGVPQNEQGSQRTEVGNFHGAGHAIRRSLFDKVGHLDEQCFFGAEEIEFTMRALGAGMKTMFTPEVTVRHYNYARAGRVRLERRLGWARNYAMVLFRYLPVGTASLFSFRLLVSHMFSDIAAIKFGALMIPPAVLQGAVRGLLSSNHLDAKHVAFYTNPATRPELGNVSLVSKIRRRLSQA